MKKHVLFGGILALGALLLGSAIVLRARDSYRINGRNRPRSQAEIRETSKSIPHALPVAKPTDAKTQGVLLHDVTLLGLIQNAKVASIQGDAVTRKAMLDGLKKEPNRARELIQMRISSARSEEETAALAGLLKELP